MSAPTRKFRWIGLACLGGLLASCNVFNPSGDGDYPDDAKAHIDLGQRALQRQDFREAWNQFSQALREDSTKSLAYQGLAKAELGVDTFEISSLVTLADSISKASDDRKIGILANKNTAWFGHVYRPLLRVARYYSILSRWDSLGLTDKVFPRRLVRTELGTILNNQSYFLLIDLPDPVTHRRDTVITDGELAALRLMDISHGGLKFDLAKLPMVDGKLDTNTRNSINNLLLNVDAIHSDTTLMSQLLGSTSTGGSDPTTDVSQDAREFLGDLGQSNRFFLINDSLDNDGDGCINEERSGEGIDDDGDGLIDEDGHVGIVPPLKFVLESGKLEAVGRVVADTSWIDTSGVPRHPRWVSVLDAPSGNAAIYDSLSKAPANAGKSQDDIRQAVLMEIRTRVLAKPMDATRVELGKKTVGGCWDHVQ